MAAYTFIAPPDALSQLYLDFGINLCYLLFKFQMRGAFVGSYDGVNL